MTTEDRLRDALHAEANATQPRDGWIAIEARLAHGTAPRNRARLLMAAAAAVLVLVAAVAVLAQRDSTRTPVLTNPGEATTTPTTVVPVDSDLPRYIWPFDNAARYANPESIADAFARTFLAMPDPTVSQYRAGDAHSGEIDIHPYPTGTISTTLVVREDANGWHIVSARSDNLQLDSPAQYDTIASPVRLTGRSVAFEGTVHVTLYGYGADADTTKHPFIATSTFTANGTELGPFATTFSFGPTAAEYGLLMLWTDSARDGSLAEATVVLVKLA